MLLYMGLVGVKVPCRALGFRGPKYSLSGAPSRKLMDMGTGLVLVVYHRDCNLGISGTRASEFTVLALGICWV